MGPKRPVLSIATHSSAAPIIGRTTCPSETKPEIRLRARIRVLVSTQSVKRCIQRPPRAKSSAAAISRVTIRGALSRTCSMLIGRVKRQRVSSQIHWPIQRNMLTAVGQFAGLTMEGDSRSSLSACRSRISLSMAPIMLSARLAASPALNPGACNLPSVAFSSVRRLAITLSSVCPSAGGSPSAAIWFLTVAIWSAFAPCAAVKVARHLTISTRSSLSRSSLTSALATASSI